MRISADRGRGGRDTGRSVPAVLVHHVDVARLAPASVREGSASKRVGRTSTRFSQWHCAAADAGVDAGASSFVGSDCVVVPAAAPASIDSDVLPSEGGATACDFRRYAVRHHFLARLYALAELRPEPAVAALGDFQRRHKHLLMVCDQHAMRTLGAIAADTGPDAAERYRRYAHLFRRALARLPSRGAYVNALMHMYGHFKDTIDAAERQMFLELLDAIGEGQRSFHDVAGVIAGWCERFGYGYLADQSLLAPYPRSLVRSEQTPAGVAF